MEGQEAPVCMCSMAGEASPEGIGETSLRAGEVGMSRAKTATVAEPTASVDGLMNVKGEMTAAEKTTTVGLGATMTVDMTTQIPRALTATRSDIAHQKATVSLQTIPFLRRTRNVSNKIPVTANRTNSTPRIVTCPTMKALCRGPEALQCRLQ